MWNLGMNEKPWLSRLAAAEEEAEVEESAA
jgi:hypothetical protein